MTSLSSIHWTHGYAKVVPRTTSYATKKVNRFFLTNKLYDIIGRRNYLAAIAARE